MFGYRYSRLNITHFVFFAGLGGGLVGGVVLGHKYFGMWGAILAGILGGIIGVIPYFVLDHWAHQEFFKEITGSSNEKLRANLEQSDWNFSHTMSLLQLAARKEDIEPYFERILVMLESDSERVREFGFDALRFVFTEKMNKAPGYDPNEPTEMCRRKAKLLRAA